MRSQTARIREAEQLALTHTQQTLIIRDTDLYFRWNTWLLMEKNKFSKFITLNYKVQSHNKRIIKDTRTKTL